MRSIEYGDSFLNKRVENAELGGHSELDVIRGELQFILCGIDCWVGIVLFCI